MGTSIKGDYNKLLKFYPLRGHPRDFKPLHADVLIRLNPKDEVSDGGIILPSNYWDEVQWVEVIAVGHENKDVKPGDRVAAKHNYLNGDILQWDESADENGQLISYELIGPDAVLAVEE